MEVLIVLAHPDETSLCVTAARDTDRQLTRQGHHVQVLDLYAEGFDPVMSRADRIAYESDHPIVDVTVERHAELVRAAEALIFIYPMLTGGLPAMLKGWLDRVLVMGVAFELQPRTRKVKAGLRQVRRIGVVTTSGSGRAATMVVNDAGRRTLNRTVRLICHPLARRTFLALYRDGNRSEPERNVFLDRVQKAFSGWT